MVCSGGLSDVNDNVRGTTASTYWLLVHNSGRFFFKAKASLHWRVFCSVDNRLCWGEFMYLSEWIVE